MCVSLLVYRVMRDPSGFIPSPMDRYRKILLPALRLFQVILTSTTMNHQQGAAQVKSQLVIERQLSNILQDALIY